MDNTHHIRNLKLINDEFHRELGSCRNPEDLIAIHEGLNYLAMAIASFERTSGYKNHFKD